MNQSNLHPQGRFSDDRLQQMVLDELNRQGVAPEKFYFTSDDWMISPDHAWNSVFGLALYRQVGQPMYAECGVSSRYDSVTSSWSEPAATVKIGMPLTDEAYAAAPGALQSDGATGDAETSAAEAPLGAANVPDSSQTVLADAIPGLPEAAAAGAADAASDSAAVAAAAAEGQGADNDEGASPVPAGDEWSSAERADGQPRVEPGPGVDWHDHPANPEPDHGPVPAGDVWSNAQPAETSTDDVETDLRQAGDLGVDEAALAGSGVAAAAAGAAGGSGGQGVPSYESAGAEAEAREHPAGVTDSEPDVPSYEAAGAEVEAHDYPVGRDVHLGGYELTIREDGTAELRVPLGGQVTLRWAGQ